MGHHLAVRSKAEVTTEAVVNIGVRLQALGVDKILLADTIGCAVPSQVRERSGPELALEDFTTVGVTSTTLAIRALQMPSPQ
ncbi:MAG: hypothetical protein CM1200mP18_04930 [Gammaproteobacteria bacterium]|nr:MAG: hypothetical protein CM1200mP18_04930 [Gammaproteobacteria bacterium]